MGSIGPLWWHMAEVENFEIFEVLGTVVRLGAQRGIPNLLSTHDQVVVANVKHFGETGINHKGALSSETLKTITGRRKMRIRGS